MRVRSRRAVLALLSVPRTTVRATSSTSSTPPGRLQELRARLVRDRPYPLIAVAKAPSSSPPSAVVDDHLSQHVSETANTDPLVDRFGRRHTYLRVSLTERCNLRCTYCMPADGVPLSPQPHLLTTAEVLAACSALVHLGVTKIRLTGGEPTLRPDVIEISAALGALPGLRTLAMTTNGVLLPRLLPGLLAAGVSHYNISVDTLRRERFESISRRSAAHWDRAWDGLHSALAAGTEAARVKLNCVVVRGFNDDELPAFVKLTEQLPLQVRFIELMPFAANGWAEPQFVAWAEQRDAILRAYPAFKPQTIPVTEGAVEAAADTARVWHVPGHVGTVGFVASMSSAFCGSCNRMRLTADGRLRACLHSDAEVDLRDAVRRGTTSDELTAIVRRALRGKAYALGGHVSRFDLADAAINAGAAGRPMVRIGG